jgi:HK97 family phage portal protein
MDLGNFAAAIWRSAGWNGLSNSERGEQRATPLSRNSDAGVNVGDQRAMQVSAVWSCARLITETVGSLPIGVYEKTATGRDVVTDHYLHELLRVSPNAMMTPLEFREALTLQLVLWGNGYAFVERSAAGRPLSLTPLAPDRMKVVRSDGGLTYHYSTDKGTHVYAQQSILHLKGFSTDGVVGLSPIGYAAHTLGLTVAADRYASKAFSSGGRPAGVLTVDKFLTPDQRDQLRTIYTQIAAEESTGTWVLEGGTQYQAIGINPNDMQLLASRSFQLAEIARIFRVPSYLINDTERSTSWGTGIEQQNLGFLTYTLRPYLTRWESTVSDSLLDRAGRKRYFVEHNVEGLLRADSAARSAFYSTAAQNGWMSRNEIRRKENMPPVVGGDELTVQVNLTPVDQLPGLSNGNQTATD